MATFSNDHPEPIRQHEAAERHQRSSGLRRDFATTEFESPDRRRACSTVGRYGPEPSEVPRRATGPRAHAARGLAARCSAARTRPVRSASASPRALTDVRWPQCIAPAAWNRCGGRRRPARQPRGPRQRVPRRSFGERRFSRAAPMVLYAAPETPQTPRGPTPRAGLVRADRALARLCARHRHPTCATSPGGHSLQVA